MEFERITGIKKTELPELVSGQLHALEAYQNCSDLGGELQP